MYCKDCYGLNWKRDYERIIFYKENGNYYEDTNKVVDILNLNDSKIPELINNKIIKCIGNKITYWNLNN